MTPQEKIEEQIKTKVREELLKSTRKVEAYNTKQPGKQPLFLLAYVGFVIFATAKILK
jgi:hypothetical protein